MVARKVILLGAAAAILAAGAGSLLLHQPPDLREGVFANKLAHRVEIHPGELVRTVDYRKGHYTPTRAQSLNQDGSTTYFWYREDGTLKEAKVYYAADESGNVSLKRESYMAADGKTYLKDRWLYPDGTVEKLVSAGKDEKNASHLEYYQSGQLKLDQSLTLTNKGWVRESEVKLRDDGTKISTYHRLPNEGWELQEYSDKEVPTRLASLTDYATNLKDIRYADDGTTVLRELTQNSSGTTLTTHRPDGSLIEKRVWNGPVNDKIFTVTYYDEHSKPTLNQHWLEVNGKGSPWLIQLFDKNGKEIRTIIFVSGTDRVQKDFHLEDPGNELGKRTVYEYREDGSLETIEHFDRDGTRYQVDKVPQDKNIQAPKVDPSWVSDREHETPPQVVPYSPPHE